MSLSVSWAIRRYAALCKLGNSIVYTNVSFTPLFPEPRANALHALQLHRANLNCRQLSLSVPVALSNVLQWANSSQRELYSCVSWAVGRRAIIFFSLLLMAHTHFSRAWHLFPIQPTERTSFTFFLLPSLPLPPPSSRFYHCRRRRRDSFMSPTPPPRPRASNFSFSLTCITFMFIICLHLHHIFIYPAPFTVYSYSVFLVPTVTSSSFLPVDRNC